MSTTRSLDEQWHRKLIMWRAEDVNGRRTEVQCGFSINESRVNVGMNGRADENEMDAELSSIMCSHLKC